MTIRRLAATLVATAAAVAALTACGSTGTSAVGSSEAGFAAPAAPLPVTKGVAVVPRGGTDSSLAAGAQVAAPAPAGAGSAGPGTALVIGSPPSADIERSVTAAYTVPPGAFLDSFQGVITRAVGIGGYVVSSNTSPDSSGRIVSGSVALKVPAAKIAAFLDSMPSTFTASSINFASIDHTAEFVDVNARLASARAHLAALDTLLARATSIADITTLEQQVEAVQTEVDTDQGQLNVLTASVDLATATVALSERGAVVAQPAPPGPVGGGVSGGWNNAVQVTGAVLEGAISALPLLALAVAAWLVWRRVLRPTVARRHRSEVAD